MFTILTEDFQKLRRQTQALARIMVIQILINFALIIGFIWLAITK